MTEPVKIETEDTELGRVQKLIEVIEPITSKAEGIIKKVQTIAWLYLVGALALTGVLFLPLSTQSTLAYAFVGLILLLLAGPSGILFLFHQGLKSVISLPGRLLEKAGIREASARTMLQAVGVAQKEDSDVVQGKILRTLSVLRRQVQESKDLLLEYSVILRMANPFVLAIVGLATLSGFVVSVAAVIAILIAVF